MPASIDIRKTENGDVRTIEEVYRLAFPDEDLIPLLHELLAIPDDVLSLCAAVGSVVVGHALFSRCAVGSTEMPVALLGPLAVHPQRQRQGVGRALVDEGLSQLKSDDVCTVFVLGDPAYYRRLGFSPEAVIQPPYLLPTAWESAWQSRRLDSGASTGGGTLRVPAAWQKAALWSP